MRTKVINQYQILRKLGSGAGGVVYYARDSKLLRPVVLKMLRMPKGRATPLRKKSCARHGSLRRLEIQRLRDLRGRRVRGDSFIVMQYVPGRTLAQLICGDRLSLQLALSISIRSATGWREAHPAASSIAT